MGVTCFLVVPPGRRRTARAGSLVPAGPKKAAGVGGDRLAELLGRGSARLGQRRKRVDDEGRLVPLTAAGLRRPVTRGRLPRPAGARGQAPRPRPGAPVPGRDAPGGAEGER